MNEYVINENGNYLNVETAVPARMVFSHVYEAEEFNGKYHFKATVALPDSGDLQGLLAHVNEWAQNKYDEYRASIPADKRHKARAFKKVTESKMFREEMMASGPDTEAAPTGNVLFSAKTTATTSNGETKVVPVFYRRDGRVTLDSEIARGSQVLLSVSFAMYGNRFPHEGALNHVGVTCYLNAVRVLKWGDAPAASGSALSDAALDALLEATEEQSTPFDGEPTAAAETSTDDEWSKF